MSTGETKNITGTLKLTDKYQTTIYNDIVIINGAVITLFDPAGEIFTDKGDDTVTVTDTTITSSSQTGTELMFSMGSDNDALTITNSTLNVDTFMGSGNDSILVSGTPQSQVNINKKFSLGSGDDTLTLEAQLTGSGTLIFGDGNDTLVFNGGSLLTTGEGFTDLENLVVKAAGGILNQGLRLTGEKTSISLYGNLTASVTRTFFVTGSSGGKNSNTLTTADNVKITSLGFCVKNSVFTHTTGGSLEITDVDGMAVNLQESTVTFHDLVISYSSKALNAVDTNLTLIDSDIAHNTTAGDFTGGSLHMEKVTFSNNENGLSLSNTELTGADVSFTANNNRALHMVNANGNLMRVTFSENYGSANADASKTASAGRYPVVTSIATAWGGAIAHNSGKLTLTAATLSRNYAKTNAYSKVHTHVYHHATATSIATAWGGAIAHNSDDLNLLHTIFSGNYASANASAYAENYGVGAYISATATSRGGAIAAENIVLNLTSATFSGNYATATAIATVYSDAYQYETAYITASAIAWAHGGAIAAKNTILNLIDTTFSGNYASASATATSKLYGYNSSTVTSTARSQGGAIYLHDSTMTYTVTADKIIVCSGNDADIGDFLYSESSDSTFVIDGELTIANSVAGSKDSTITKLGNGVLSFGAAVASFSGSWTINAGTLMLANASGYQITLDKWTIGVNGILHLSSGNDTITMGTDKKIGTINFGVGTDTLNTGGYHLSGGQILFKNLTIKGDGSVASALKNGDSGSGFELTLAGVTIDNDIIGGDYRDCIQITNSTTISGTVDLGNGSNSIIAVSGTTVTIDGDLLAGGGADGMSFANVNIGGEVRLQNGANSLTVTDTAEFHGAVICTYGYDTITLKNATFYNDVDLGNGVNKIKSTGIVNFYSTLYSGVKDDIFDFSKVTFRSTVDLGEGNDTFSVSSTATFSGDLKTGAGNDTVTFSGATSVSGLIDMGTGKNAISIANASLSVQGAVRLNKNSETRLIVYNGASLNSNRLTVYADENAERITANLDWSDIEGLDKVRILVSSDATFETFEFTVELYNQTKSFTLNVEKGYYIQFQAQDEDGWAQRFLTDKVAPGQISNFAMTGTTANWEHAYDNFNGNGVKQYNIQVASDANFNSVIETHTSTENSYSFASYADGNYFIRIQAEDYTGNKGEWSNVENLLIDTTAPIAPGFLQGQTSGSSLTAQWGTSIDAGSGVKEYKIEFSKSSSFSTIAHSATVSGTSYTATDLTDGTYYFRIAAIDLVGNASPWESAACIIDTTAPEKISDLIIIQNANVVSLSWNDAVDVGVGVKEYVLQYSADSAFNTIMGAQTVSDTDCNIYDLADGVYYYRICAVDQNNNVGSWHESSFVVDSTKPTVLTALYVHTGNYSATLNWSAADDVLSGVKEYEYIISHDSNFTTGIITGKTEALTKTVSMLDYGVYYCKVRAIDNHGNIGDWSNTEMFTIADITPPELTVIYTPETWTNQDIVVSVSAFDFGSGSKTIEYSMDNYTWKTGDHITVSDNGIVYFRAVDNSGNMSEIVSCEITNIDSVAPSLEILRDTENVAKQVMLTVHAKDNLSGINSTQFSFDNVSWFTGDSVTVNENKMIYFRVTDNAGNITEKTVMVDNIDNLSPDKPIAMADITSATNQRVTVSATFSDDSVVREYSMDNEVWFSYHAGIVMSANGTVYFRSQDEAGNYSDITEYHVVNIDRTAPMKPIVVADETEMTNGVVIVTATFTDDSVIKQYSTDLSNWKDYTEGGVVMSTNGTVYFRGRDAVGNYSAITSYEVKNIDKSEKLVVTTTHDVVDPNDGVTSLREAVAYAAEKKGKYTITFAVDGTFILNSVISIGCNITIAGNGSDKTIFDGGGISQIFHVNDVNAAVSLSGMTIQNGYAENGGAILNNGTLAICDTVFKNNISTSQFIGGGAIRSTKTLTVTNSEFIGNTASWCGAAIYAGDSTIVQDCLFEGNSAGGSGSALYFPKTVWGVINNCTFSENTTVNDGCVFVNGTLYLLNSTATNNGPDAITTTPDGSIYAANDVLVGNGEHGDFISHGNAHIWHSVIGNLSGDPLKTEVNLTTSVDGSDVFENIDINGNAVANADGIYQLKDDGVAIGSGAFVWHNADYTAIAYSITIGGAKTAIAGVAAAATHATVYNNDIAENAVIVSNHYVEVTNGGIVYNTIVHDGGRLYIAAGGLQQGYLQIEDGALVSVHDNAVIDFTIAGRSCTEDYLINDLSRIEGSPIYTITVSEDQTFGIYKLARGAQSFTNQVLIGTETECYGMLVANGEEVLYDGITYSLILSNEELTLFIGDLTPPTEPIVTADITKPTNGKVTVTAEFSSDCVIREYSLNNKIWKNYYGGIEFDSNGTVYFRGQDEAGNWSEVTSYNVSNIDTVTPEAPTVAADKTAVTNQKVTISAAFSADSVRKEYSLDGKNWKAYTAGIVFNANGTVYFRGQDEAGNWSAVTSYQVSNIDTVAPDAPTVAADITSVTNQKVTVNAVFSIDSALKQYSFGNDIWMTYTTGIEFTANGTVYFRGQDDAGNWSKTTSFTVTNIDTEPPAKPEISADKTAPTNEVVTVSAVFSDDSILKEYSFDKENWYAYTDGIRFTDNGTVWFRGKDQAENYSTICSYYVTNIDKTAPEVPTAAADITSVTNSKVTVSAVFSDDTVKKEYSLDNLTWQLYTSGVAMQENGTVYFRGQDEAGNYSDEIYYTVNNIDTVAPESPIVSADVTNPTNSKVTVAAGFSSDSIVREYSLNNKDWYAYIGEIEFIDNDTVYFRAADEAGNWSAVTTFAVSNIDKTAPVAPAANADITTVTNRNVTVRAEFSSDSVEKEYSFDNKTWWTYTGGIVFSANGTVYFRGQDEAGNWSEVTSYQVGNIDTVAPDAPAASADVTSPTNQKVTVSATFSSDSVVKEYSFDGKVWNSYTAGIEFTANGTVYFRSQDEAGNWSDVTTYQVSNIDTVAPDAPAVSADKTAPTNQTVTVSATFSSDSVVNEYSLDGKVWNSYTAGIEFTANGTVYFRSQDEAGNWSEVTSYQVTNIDKTAPARPSAVADKTAPTNQNVIVNATFDDSADVAVNQYSIDGIHWTAYPAQGVVMTEVGTVYFRSIDNAGNISEVFTCNVNNIDKIAPAAPTVSADITGSTNQEVNVTAVFPADSAILQYKIGNGEWTAYSEDNQDRVTLVNGKLVFTTASNNTVSFRSVDAAGNISASNSYSVVNIDTVAPLLNISGITAEPTNQNVTLRVTTSSDATLYYSLTGADDSWIAFDGNYEFSANGEIFFKAVDTAGNVTVSEKIVVPNIDKTAPVEPVVTANTTAPTNQNVILTAVYSSDSVLKQYSFNGSSWLTYDEAAGVTVSANGIVYFRAGDAAGNISAIVSKTVSNIDTVAPDAPTASADITAVTNQKVTVSAVFSNDSVVKEYSLDGKSWNSYTAGIGFTANGTVYFRSQDEAGNWSEATSFTVSNIDTEPPAKPVTAADKTAPTNEVVTVSATFSGDSILKEYSFDKENWFAYTDGIRFADNGTVYFRSKDQAGNYSTIASYHVTNIDKIAPVAPVASADKTAATNQTVTVSAVFSDDTAKKEYSLDNVNWRTYISGVVMQENGIIYFRGQDEAGNISASASYVVSNIYSMISSENDAPAGAVDLEDITAEKPVDFSDKVGVADTADCYKFTILDAAEVSFDVTTTDSLKFTLFTITENGKIKNITTQSVKAASSVQTKQAMLNAGTYYIKIVSSNKKNGDAEFSVVMNEKTVFFTRGDNSDDWTDVRVKGSVSAEVNKDSIGTLSAATKISDWVGFGDIFDYQQFILKEDAKLNFQISSSDALKVVIYKLNGAYNAKTDIATYSLKALQSTTIAAGYTLTTKDLLLENGTYYIGVTSTNAAKGGNADYTITVDESSKFFSKVDNSDDWTDVKTAGAKGAVGKIGDTFKIGTTVSDWVGYGDAADYKSFTITEKMTVSFDVFASDAAKFNLYTLNENTNGTFSLKSLLSSSVSAGQTAPTKSITLAAGTYYIGMTSTNAKKGGDADYTITMKDPNATVTPVIDNTDDWTDLKTKGINGKVAELGTVDENIKETGWVGTGDVVDYMTFTLDNAASLSFDLSATDAAKFVVYELKENYNKKTGETTFSLKALQTTTVKAGYTVPTKNLLLESGKTYAIGVTSTNAAKGGSAEYSFVLNDNATFFTKADNSDDVFTDAKVIDITSGVSDGWVGYSDSVDYMEFTLDTAAKLNFDVASSDSAKFVIYQLNDKTGKLKALQTTTIKADTVMPTKDLFLAAGTYYISMTSTNAAKGGNADYSFKLNDAAVFYPEAGDNSDDTWKLVQNSEAARLDGTDINGWVGYSDAADFVKLELDGSGAISLDLDDVTATAYERKELKITCVDDKGKAIALSYDAATESFTSKLTFTEGTVCYIGVSTADQKKYDTEYQITAGILV